MATEKFANNSQSTITVAMSSFVSFCQVSSNALFPLQPQFRIIIENEIMLVTSVVGNIFGVQRGAEGTIAAPHASGTPIFHVLTAGALGKLTQDFAGPTGPVGSMGPPGPTGPVGPPGSGGGSSNPNAEVSLVAGLFTTDNSTFTRIGGRMFDMAPFPATVGSLNRHVKFVADVDKTAGASSVEVQFFDRTDNTSVTGTDMSSATVPTVELTSPDLIVGSTNGNLRDDAPKFYEVQLRMNGGVPGVDAVFCENARLVITYV